MAVSYDFKVNRYLAIPALMADDGFNNSKYLM